MSEGLPHATNVIVQGKLLISGILSVGNLCHPKRVLSSGFTTLVMMQSKIHNLYILV